MDSDQAQDIFADRSAVTGIGLSGLHRPGKRSCLEQTLRGSECIAINLTLRLSQNSAGTEEG